MYIKSKKQTKSKIEKRSYIEFNRMVRRVTIKGNAKCGETGDRVSNFSRIMSETDRGEGARLESGGTKNTRRGMGRECVRERDRMCCTDCP